MILQWVLFCVTIFVAYIGISLFAQLSGASSTGALQAFLSTLRPIPLIVVTIANMFFGLGLYYGFSLTRFAIPIAISIGVMTSFVYSLIFLGAHVTAYKIGGLILILLGVVLLGL
jgi:hypothetical protein